MPDYNRTVSESNLTNGSMHPFGSGFAVPPGHDPALSAQADSVAAAAFALAQVDPGRRAELLRRLLSETDSPGMADALVEHLLQASPEAAAAANGLDIDAVDDMSPACLEHRLSDAERQAFEERGYVHIRGVLSPQEVTRLLRCSEELDSAWRGRMGVGEGDRLNLLDAFGAAASVGLGEPLLELLDHPKIFAKVFDLLGYNISLCAFRAAPLAFSSSCHCPHCITTVTWGAWRALRRPHAAVSLAPAATRHPAQAIWLAPRFGQPQHVRSRHISLCI